MTVTPAPLVRPEARDGSAPFVPTGWFRGDPADFDYAFNLAYGRRYTAGDPVLEALRARLDVETARLARERSAL